MPGAYFLHTLGAAHQHGMHPLTEQSFRELCVLLSRTHKITEGAKHVTIEPITRGKQCGCAGSESHAFPFELLQGVPPGSQLCQRFLCLAPVSPVHCLAFAAFSQKMARVLRSGCGPLRLMTEKAGP